MGWSNVNKTMNYLGQLRNLNMPPLAMSLQLNDMLLLSKIPHEKNGNNHWPTRETRSMRRKNIEIFKLWKKRTKTARIEFVFRNRRLVNGLGNWIDFMNPQGLKKRLLNLLRKFVKWILLGMKRMLSADLLWLPDVLQQVNILTDVWGLDSCRSSCYFPTTTLLLNF